MLNVFPRIGGSCSEARVLTRTLAEKLASDLLAREGIPAIWDLHLAAASARSAGKLEIAASLIEIADAAEREASKRKPGAAPG